MYFKILDLTFKNQYILALISSDIGLLCQRSSPSQIFKMPTIHCEGDEHKVAFKMPIGNYDCDYLVMPFSLTNVPAISQACRLPLQLLLFSQFLPCVPASPSRLCKTVLLPSVLQLCSVFIWTCKSGQLKSIKNQKKQNTKHWVTFFKDK